MKATFFGCSYCPKCFAKQFSTQKQHGAEHAIPSECAYVEYLLPSKLRDGVVDQSKASWPRVQAMAPQSFSLSVPERDPAMSYLAGVSPFCGSPILPLGLFHDRGIGRPRPPPPLGPILVFCRGVEVFRSISPSPNYTPPEFLPTRLELLSRLERRLQ